MTKPKFRTGETVYMTRSTLVRAPGGAYTILRQLPEERGEHWYRVKSAHEANERVVKETEIEKA